ncbi:MAG: hypothetical protein QM811_09615 [Pirellulales bacterium]
MREFFAQPSRRRRAARATLLAGLCLFGQAANAGLIIDLRFSDGTKTKTAAPGTYTVDIWAQLVAGTNGNANDDGILTFYGAARSGSTNGGVLASGVGNGITGIAAAAPFTLTPSNGNLGTGSDLNGDGIQDWGNTTTSVSSTPQPIKFNAFSAGDPNNPVYRNASDLPAANVNAITGGFEYKVGSFTYTISASGLISSPTAGATTTLDWVKSTGVSYIYKADGVQVTAPANYTSGAAANGVSFTAGTVVPPTGNDSVLTKVADGAFGRVFQGQTPTLSPNLTFSKTGTSATNYSASSSAGISVTPATGSVAAGSVASTPLTVALLNSAAGTGSVGPKTFTVTLDNTATDSAAAGQGSADGDETYNVTATVVAQRVVTAGTVNLGRRLNTTNLSAITTNSVFTTTEADNVATRVTVNGQLFNGPMTPSLAVTGGAGVVAASGVFNSYAVTGEGLAGEGTYTNVAVNYTATPVAARTFDAGSALALGRFKVGSLPATTKAISSTGVLATTASANLGAFNAVNGLTLTTTDPVAFNGGAASQTATYNLGGTAAAGAISGTFTATATDEFGNTSSIAVPVTGTAVNARTFTPGAAIALGRVLAGAAPTGVTRTVSSSGLHADTVDATLGTFSAVGGLTLTTGGGTVAFNGTASPQTATYTLGGTTAVGAISGSFTATATDEFAATSNVAIPVTGTAVGVRTVTAPTAVTLPSNLLSGATVSIPYAATGGTYGGGTGVTADTENATLTLPGSPSNGLNLTGSTSVTTAGNVLTLSGKVVGNGAVSGNLSVGVSRELSGAQTAITYVYSGNVGGAAVGAGNAFGTPLTATVATNAAYVGLAATASGSGSLGTVGTLLAGTNRTGASETVSMAVRTRTAAETGPVTSALFSTTPNGLVGDVVRLTGMSGTVTTPDPVPGHRVGTDAFALQLSFNPTAVSAAGFNPSQLQLSWLDNVDGVYGNADDKWVSAVNGNFLGGDANGDSILDGALKVTGFLGSFAAFAGSTVTDANLSNYLGSYGVDPANGNVWAVLNHNSDFSVDLGAAVAVPEPSSFAAGTLLALGCAAFALRKRRSQTA